MKLTSSQKRKKKKKKEKKEPIWLIPKCEEQNDYKKIIETNLTAIKMLGPNW